jgi:hypothetical protein
MALCYVCCEDDSMQRFIDPSPCKCKGTTQIHNTCYEIIKRKIHACPNCKQTYSLHYINGYANVVRITNGHRYEYTVDISNNIQNVFKVYDETDDSYIYELRYYKDNEIVGHAYGYYCTGELEDTTPYINNKKHGYRLYYNKNCTIKRATPYMNGVIHGLEYIYYPNGILENIVPFNAGLIDGTIYDFNINGELKFIMQYKHNIPHGLYQNYHTNGLLREVLHYNSGKRHGQHLIYYNNGVVRKRVYWLYGRRVKRQTYFAHNIHTSHPNSNPSQIK